MYRNHGTVLHGRRAEAERELARVDSELARVRSAIERLDERVVCDFRPSKKGVYLFFGGIGAVMLLSASALDNASNSTNDSGSHCGVPLGAQVDTTTAAQSPYSTGK